MKTVVEERKHRNSISLSRESRIDLTEWDLYLCRGHQEGEYGCIDSGDAGDSVQISIGCPGEKMQYRDTKPELQICFVAYADILGYRKIIQDCENDYNALLRELENFKLKILGPQKGLSESIEALRGTVSFFSDSVFIHVPILSDCPQSFDDGRVEICLPIEDLARYQFDLAIEGIFIRGGATVNFGYMDNSIAFGPGLIDAVECEEIAEYPRICLTEWAMHPIKEYIDNHWPGDERIAKFIIHRNDGIFFINYLYTIIDYIENECDPIPEDFKEYPLYNNVPDAIDLMRKHKENIETNLTNKDPKIEIKFSWLAKYHNFFCKKYFRDLSDLIIADYDEMFYSISPKKT